MPPSDAELASLLDTVIGRRPAVDAAALTAALEALCRARDVDTDPLHRERISLLIILVMGVKHPIGAPPWDALVAALTALPPSGAVV